jgi:FkbH-like protein
MGYSAYVEFKNWSQLWAQGNATQLPNIFNQLLQSVGAAAWTLSAPFDSLLRKATGRKRLSVLLQAVRRRLVRLTARLYNQFPKPDCLLIEIFNPMAAVAQLQLRVKGSGGGRFEWTETASVGFCSLAIPVAELERRIDLSRPFEMALTVQDEVGKRLYFCSATFVRLTPTTTPAATSAGTTVAKKIKCVVWDLDHTLWDGILVEAQPTDFRLRDGLRSILTELDRRGVLLSIASKNNEEDARKVLESLGVWDLFLAPQISWQPKSASLKQVAERLNIGLDSLAFVDDMAFERDEVVTALPMVTVVPADEVLSILGRPEFSGDASGEGATRRQMYQVEVKREQAMAAAGLGYDEFLATCQIRVVLRRPDTTSLPRIFDIVQRTNQLNIATERYEMNELRALIQDPDRHCYLVECSDKYGNYGHIGFVVIALQAEGILLHDCMFSCRVQGKRIDEAVLAHLINHYVRDGALAIKARFKPTKRNAPAGEMLARLGFNSGQNSDGLLAIEPASPRPEVPCVSITRELGAPARA